MKPSLWKQLKYGILPKSKLIEICATLEQEKAELMLKLSEAERAYRFLKDKVCKQNGGH